MDFSALYYFIPLLIGIVVITLLLIILLKAWIIQYFLKISLRRSIKDIAGINLTVGILIFLAMLITLGPKIGDRVTLYENSSSYYTTQEFAFKILPLWGIACVISIFLEGLLIVLAEKNHPQQSIWIASILGNLLGYLVLFIIFILIYHYL